MNLYFNYITYLDITLTKMDFKAIIIMWSKIIKNNWRGFMYNFLYKAKNIIIMSIASVFLFASSAYADGINIVIDGKARNFNTEPIVESDRVLLPIRDTFEAIGANVSWSDETYEATAVKGEKTVIVKPDSTELYINGEKLVMDVPALERDDRIFIPVRFAAEAFNCTVLWDENSDTVTIYTLDGFSFYEEAHAPVFTDVISSAVLENEENENGEKTYTYKTTYDDVTEYFMSLQESFGFEAYSVDFGENASTVHVYVNPFYKEAVTVICEDLANGYKVSLVLKTNAEKEETKPEIQPPAEENPSDDTEYYESTNNTLPTYSSITGAKLIEKTTENDMDIYKYNDTFMGVMQYTMAIEFSGYHEYSIDMNFGSITRYYSNNDTIVGITSSMLTNEVWIIIPHKK